MAITADVEDTLTDSEEEKESQEGHIKSFRVNSSSGCITACSADLLLNMVVDQTSVSIAKVKWMSWRLMDSLHQMCQIIFCPCSNQHHCSEIIGKC